MKVGVLALQGAVIEHIRMIESAGAEAVAVKTIDQLADLDGIIIPGGESTTIGKLIRKYGFLDALKQFSAERKPIFGTCAGLIIIAGAIEGQEEAHLELMDMRVSRNAFGRQRESFEMDLDLQGLDAPFRAVFIRAPLITEVGSEVQVLATVNEQIVAARQEHLLTTSFHPELTQDDRIHRYFLDMVRTYRA